jgi:tetratricopeptide (TPR) repeat protein
MAAGALLSACGGPMPPRDPFHLAEAKDALGRGNHWYRRGCPGEAARWFAEALESARLSDRVDLIVKSLNALGAARMAEGDLDAAAAALETALALASSDPDRPEMASVWGNLGTLAFEAGRPDDARGFWLAAIDEAGRRGASAAVFHCDLARLALSLGDEAEFRSRASLALAAAEADSAAAAKAGADQEGVFSPVRAALADALGLSARVALAGGDPASAEAMLRRALELDRGNEDHPGLAQDLEALASIEEASGRPAEAAASLDRAFYLWAAVGDRAAQKRALARLESLSAETGHPKSVGPYQEVASNPGLFDPRERLCP